MASEWDTKGKTCLVTGGASGIGAITVEWFLKEGAKKVAILDIAEEKAKELVEHLNKTFTDQVAFYKCDISKEDQISQVFDKVVEDFKKVDVIINNAGIFDDSPDKWRRACDINWQGVVSLTLKGIKHMRKDQGGDGGTIINVSSVAALQKFPYLPIYNGSKAAVLHFSQTISAHPDFYAETGIRVMAMCYGGTDTPLLDSIHEKAWDEALGKNVTDMVEPAVPLQRPESAAAALFNMYRRGSNGCIWISANDNGGKDITATIDETFKKFDNIVRSA